MNERRNESLLFLYGFFDQLKTYLHERCMQIHTVCTKEEAPKKYVHKFLPVYLEFELKEAIRAKIRIK